MAFSPTAWKVERVTWRAVIYLNLVRSITRIVGIINESHIAAGGVPATTNTNANFETTHENVLPTDLPNSYNPYTRSRSSTDPTDIEHQHPSLADDDEAEAVEREARLRTMASDPRSRPDPVPSRVLQLALRLSPLRLVENSLVHVLSSDPAASSSENILDSTPASQPRRTNGREIFVSASTWKNALVSKLSRRRTSSTDLSDANDPIMSDDIFGMLQALRDDMVALWNDQYVRSMLARRRFRPQDSSGL